MVELVGGVEGSPTVEPGPDAGELAKRKAAGNVVEVGSIFAFGFSPLWLLAAASDLTHGSRVYLTALEDELKAAGVIDKDVDAHSVDELLGVPSRTRRAGQRDWSTFRRSTSTSYVSRSQNCVRRPNRCLRPASWPRCCWRSAGQAAADYREPLLEVSAGVGLAFLTSAHKVSGRHVVAPYREDWKPLQDEGLAAYARRVGGPYRRAISRHLDAGEASRTERLIDRLEAWRRRARDSWSRVSGRLRPGRSR